MPQKSNVAGANQQQFFKIKVCYIRRKYRLLDYGLLLLKPLQI